MLRRLAHWRSLPRKITAQVALLRQDPEQVGRNLAQFTNPALFEQRLLDVMHATPMHVHYTPEADRAAPERA